MNKKESANLCTLYERIKNLCKERKVSASRMCLELGLSKSTMSNMKSGRQGGISTTTAQKIASYLGVSVGYLLGEEEETQEIKKSPSAELTEGEKMLLDLFRRVPENQQQMVLQMISVALKSIE
jgi:transcriptional regulator with XRE-family HTH domain